MDIKLFEKNLKTLGGSGINKFKGLDLTTTNTIGWLISNHFTYLNVQLEGIELILDISSNKYDRILIFKDDLTYEFRYNQFSSDIELVKVFGTKVVEVGVKYHHLVAIDNLVEINMNPKIEHLKLVLEEFNDTFILNEGNCNYSIDEVYEQLKSKI